MENSIIFIFGLICALFCGYSFFKSDYEDKLSHKKALISVLRHRLGDREDTSDKFTLDELKEINVWSGKRVNEIYNEFANTCVSDDYKKSVIDANFGVMSPNVDNTTEPPRGTMPVYENPPKSYKEFAESIIEQTQSFDEFLNDSIKSGDLMDLPISDDIDSKMEIAFYAGKDSIYFGEDRERGIYYTFEEFESRLNRYGIYWKNN